MKGKSEEFTLNPIFDSRYYKIIVANDNLKEWFRVNQDALISMGLTNIDRAREILESEDEEIVKNKMINVYATIVECIFKTFDYYALKTLDIRGLSSVAYNTMYKINCIHEGFKDYNPENREIRKYNFNMIVEILKIVYSSDKYNIRYGSQTTLWDGLISDNLVFNVESHTMQNGFEDPDWSMVLLKLGNEILTIKTDYENRIPKNSNDTKVYGSTSKLIEKIYNEVKESKIEIKSYIK